MFRKNVFYENVTSDDNMLLRDIRVFKKEVSSLFKKFKKDSKSIYGCGESDLCFIFVTYSKISNVLTLSMSDGKDYIDGRSIGSPFGFEYCAETKEYVHSTPFDINDATDAWCNTYFDDISYGVFQISGVVE